MRRIIQIPLFFVALCFFQFKSIAQEFEVVFPDSMAWSQAFDAQSTDDGGFIVVGETDFPTGAIRHYIRAIKTDANGEIEWSYIHNLGAITNDRARTVIPSDDGGYFIIGSTSADFGLIAAYVIKLDADGNLVWENTYHNPNLLEYYHFIEKAILTNDGNLLLVGHFNPLDENLIDLWLIDPEGNLIWNKFYSIEPFQSIGATAYDIIQTNDGGFALSGSFNNQLLLMRMDSEADSLWTQTYTFSVGDMGFALVETNDGGFAIGGAVTGFAGFSPIIVKTDASGNLLWDLFLPQSIGAITGMIEEDNGDLVMVGSLEGFWSDYGNGFLSKVNSDGLFVGTQSLMGGDFSASNIRLCPNGSFIICGNAQGMALIKQEGFNFQMPSLVTGSIFKDDNGDCLAGMDEDSLSNWLVHFKQGNQNLYATSNSDGNYALFLMPGEYTLNLVTPNDYWESCEEDIQISLEEEGDTLTIDFGAIPLIDCTNLEVDLSAAFLRRCSLNVYHVNYCNNGTIPAEDASIEVTLDTFLTYQNSSISPSSQNGNILTFEVGDLEVGQCGNFWIQAFLDCDVEIDQIHCSEAHIFPDTTCINTNENQPLISTEAVCDNDTITFILKNIGDLPMTSASEFIVIEDDVMYLQSDFQLNVEEMIMIKIPANGSTYILITPLLPDMPESLQVTSFVEGCTVAGNNVFSTGFATTFPENDWLPAIDIDCQENIGSYDPNDKRANPKGYREQHFIDQNVDLEYHIRFQNTGNDTAFKVVILDTLSQFLDVHSFKAGSSSHDYEWEIYGEGIVKFTFDNILLPDSTTNEPASNGFIKYEISQKPDLPLETVIYNGADIYFDGNEPVYTGQTFHTIGMDFIISSTYVPISNIEMKVYPNPIAENASFLFKGMDIQNGFFNLFDSNGRLVQEQKFSGNEFYFERGTLNSGIYFFQFLEKGKLIGTGKIILK